MPGDIVIGIRLISAMSLVVGHDEPSETLSVGIAIQEATDMVGSYLPSIGDSCNRLIDTSNDVVRTADIRVDRLN